MTSIDKQKNTNWNLLFICWLIATTSTLGSLFFSYVMEFAPCVLCWYQRIFFFPLVILFAVGLFPFDAKAEDDAIVAYNQFLLVCSENGDSTTVKIFEAIIDEEQEHLNYFESINAHIEKLGSSYLARIAGTSASTGASLKGFVSGAEGE